MTFKKIFCSALLSLAFTQLISQTGNISGKILTSDDQPAPLVNIGVKGTSIGITASEKGNYLLKDLPVGVYTLVASFMGFESKENSVEVKANETVELNFMLKESFKLLQEVLVSESANKYHIKTPSSSLRINTPVIEIPQNIQIVGNDVLKDQQVISMSDGVIRNVSGATRLEHWGDLYTNITARGSQIQAFRNGFNVVNSAWGPLTEDMSFVDHIEFVKGPAGFMLANGDPSGLYNVVTKKPSGRTNGEASITMGSFDLFRGTLDLDGKLSKNGKLLYRMNLATQNKKSHRANEFNNRYVIAPVISYLLDEQTKLTFEYTYQQARMSDVGSYYIFGTTGYATLPRNFTMLPNGMPETVINDHNIFANIEHQIAKGWKITGQLGRFNYAQQGSSMWPSAVNADGTIFRAVSSWDAMSTMTMGQLFINGDFITGVVRHRMLAGIDMANKAYFADWGQYHQMDSVGAAFDPTNPNYGVPVNGYPSFSYVTPLEQRATAGGGTLDQNYTSGYVQDELGFLNNKIRLTLAGRYTNVSQSEYGGAAKTAEKFTPRTGLSVSVDQETVLYALYDQAFIPQNGKLADGSKVQPITGDNMELGVKRDWLNGKWNSSLSVYRIKKKNELIADPNSPPASNLSIVMGQKMSQGLEFDLRGRITKAISLVANYAYTDSRITQVADGLTQFKVGEIVPGYASHTANLWLTATAQGGALKGFGIAAGASFLGDRHTYWDPSPEDGAWLPDYLKVDGGIFWQKDQFKITVNVFNVMNEYLYSGSYYKWLSAYYWQTEPGRNFRVSLNYRF